MAKCEICDNDLYFNWTDTHGIAVCSKCGLPYKLIHYDENDKLIDKPPEVAIKKSWIPLGKKYWEEHHRMVYPGTYDMGILPGRGSSYSGATVADDLQFNEWLDDHESELPTD